MANLRNPVGAGLRPAHIVQLTFLLLTVLFYFFMEWLFFVTKPSFLTTLSVMEKIGVLLLSGVIPLVGASLLFLCLQLPGKFFRLPPLLAAFILAMAVLLLIDNFTITLFDFGIRSFLGVGRIPYAILFCVLFLIALRKASQWESSIQQKFSARELKIALIITGAACVVGMVLSYLTFERELQNSAARSKGTRAPNIVLIGSDGMNAQNMSVYGYQRDTTPFLRQFAREALICNRAFNNASTSLGSLTSILTGKLPIRTKLICTPDILKGADAYQHLPGVLRNRGYTSIQLTARSLSDAYDANMRAGFHQVNFRAAREQLTIEEITPFVGQEAAYFLQQTYERAADRLLHIFGISTMQDPFLEVTNPKRQAYPDSRRLKELLRFVKTSKQPFFAHIHLMKTHRIRFFKGNEEDPTSFMNDRYDDAIERFDRDLKRVTRELQEEDLLEKTIVIVYSDHGWRHSTNETVPLIMRFPNGDYHRTIANPVELVDIAPTILDYMGLEKPSWMNGQSLIAGEPDSCRWVLSARPISTMENAGKMLFRSKVGAPFFTLGVVNVATCSHFFSYDLETHRMKTESLSLKHLQCNQCKAPDVREIKDFIAEKLKENGYDTGTLR
jgi:hypothetical protein